MPSPARPLWHPNANQLSLREACGHPKVERAVPGACLMAPECQSAFAWGSLRLSIAQPCLQPTSHMRDWRYITSGFSLGHHICTESHKGRIETIRSTCSLLAFFPAKAPHERNEIPYATWRYPAPTSFATTSDTPHDKDRCKDTTRRA